MKIYKEVVIDMNPESSNYNKTISEDSFNYSGELALLGGEDWDKAWGHTPTYNIHKEAGHPGIGAMGRGFAQVGEGKGGTEKFRHPRSFPSGWLEAPTGYGVREPAGTEIKDIGTVDPRDAEGSLYAQSYNAIGEGTEKYYQRGDDLMEMADKYAADFGGEGGWYPTYMEKGITRPMEDLTAQSTDPTRGAFVSLADAASDLSGADYGVDIEGMISQIGAERPDAMAPGGYGGPIMLKTSTGELGDIADTLGQAGEEYFTEEQRLEGVKEDIESAKQKGLRDAMIARRQGIKGTLPKIEGVQSRIGKTGMAYSSPAERLRSLQTGEIAKGMEDVTLSERDVKSQYAQDIETYELEKKAMTDKWEAARTDFGGGLRDLAEAAQSSISGIEDYIIGLPAHHEQFGADITGYNTALGQADYGWGGKRGGYRFTGLDAGKMYGRGEGKHTGAPVGGWFQEEGFLPGYEQARDISGAANAFNIWLQSQKKSDLAGWLPQTPPGSTGG